MLKISDLYLTISDSKILNGISLDIANGETIGIIGPNGSGKTTLFNAISGFLSTTRGTIELKGRDITALAPHTRALNGIGRVFQNFGIFKEMTLEENLLVAIESKHRPALIPVCTVRKCDMNAVEEHLSSVGLGNRRKEKASNLSGGQMRLLEIARAIAFGADVFLLDEPTAGVSPKMKQEVELAIRKLQQLKKTVLIIEHDMNFIQQLCGRIVVLDQGKVVLDGTPDQVRNDPTLQEIYFGVCGARESHV